MKILHIGTEIYGGAGLGMYRLHRDLQSKGVESKVLCLNRGEENDESVYGYLDDLRVGGRYRRNIVTAILNRLHIYSSPYYRFSRMVGQLHNCGMVSSPYSRFDLANLDLVNEADIVHLHWVANFIDYPSFFKNVHKPIVWTLRDENPALGFWHFRHDKPKQLPVGVAKADEILSCLKAGYIRKAKSLVAVSLSNDEYAFFAGSLSFKGHKHYVIPNSIDGNVFYRHGREKIRNEYNISPDAVVIIFVAQWLSEQRKGLTDLMYAMKALDRPDIVLICIGGGESPVSMLPNRIIKTGRVTDVERLSSLFSAADYFVSPSYAETFGKTLTEALACGIPVVSYPNAGAKDILFDRRMGILCKDFTVDSLVVSMKEALDTKYDPEIIRKNVLSHFSRERVAKSYIDLYDKLLNG